MRSEPGRMLPKLMESKRYREAVSRCASWAQGLQSAGSDDAKRILREKEEFFSGMRRDYPGLYAVLEGEDKRLSELLFIKLSGRAAVLDNIR